MSHARSSMMALWGSLALVGCSLIGVEPDEIDFADGTETGALTGTASNGGDGDGDGDTGQGDGDPGDGDPGDGDPTDSETGDGDGDGDGDPTTGGGEACEGLDAAALDLGVNMVDVLDVVSMYEVTCGGVAEPDALFQFVAPADGTYGFTLTSDAIEGVLALAGPLCVPLDELACAGEDMQLQLVMATDEIVYVIVDAATAGAATITVAQL